MSTLEEDAFMVVFVLDTALKFKRSSQENVVDILVSKLFSSSSGELVLSKGSMSSAMRSLTLNASTSLILNWMIFSVNVKETNK